MIEMTEVEIQIEIERYSHPFRCMAWPALCLSALCARTDFQARPCGLH